MLECVLDEDWHQSSLDFDVKQDVGKLGKFVQEKQQGAGRRRS